MGVSLVKGGKEWLAAGLRPIKLVDGLEVRNLERKLMEKIRIATHKQSQPPGARETPWKPKVTFRAAMASMNMS